MTIYELSPLDPTAISIAIAAVSVMTIAAALSPARRATKIDTMRALRTEQPEKRRASSKCQ